MSDERFRQIVVSAFQPLVEDVPPSPEWHELGAVTPAEPKQRHDFPGWTIAVSVAVVVVLVFSIMNLLPMTDGPAGSTPTGETVGEWAVLAETPMNVYSGSEVVATDTGVLILQADATTLLTYEGSRSEGESSPLPIQPGCCGSVMGIPIDERVVVIDAYQPNTWILDTGTMTWNEVENRPSTGDILGTALIGNDLFVVTAAPRVGGSASSVVVLDLTSWTWRLNEEVPSGISVGGVATDGEWLFVAGTRQGPNNNILSTSRDPLVYRYSPSSGWEQLPDVPFDGQASTIDWVEGAGLLAWNYELEAALLGSSGEWSHLDRVPMDFSECYPHSLQVEGGSIAVCRSLALFDGRTESWASIETTTAAWYDTHDNVLYELALVDGTTRLSRYPLQLRG